MSQTTRRDPVRAVGELLLKDHDWTVEAPTIERYEATDMDTKLAREGAYIYIFQPTSTEKRAFSADYTETDDRDVVHLQMWATEKPPGLKTWLEVDAAEAFSIGRTETRTVNSGETETQRLVESAGTLEVGGTFQSQVGAYRIDEGETERHTFVRNAGTMEIGGTLEVGDRDGVNDTQTLRRDVEGILNQYANDNQQNTPFTTVRPIDGQDYRAEQIQSSGTEQVEEVYVELRGLQSA